MESGRGFETTAQWSARVRRFARVANCTLDEAMAWHQSYADTLPELRRDRVPAVSPPINSTVVFAALPHLRAVYPEAHFAYLYEYPTLRCPAGTWANQVRADMTIVERASGYMTAVIEIGDLSWDGKLQAMRGILPEPVELWWVPKYDLLRRPDDETFRLPHLRRAHAKGLNDEQ